MDGVKCLSVGEFIYPHSQQSKGTPFEHEIIYLDLPLALLAPQAPRNETKRDRVR